ncbi:MAG: transglutaminase domain-containing protein [Ruminococcus sp.]|nr:transglutaminase domain-containing protein [Ruminococcus sp.]
MKKTTTTNYNGIVICDSITMSVKKKKPDIRSLYAVIIAVTGFVSVIVSFLYMFDFNYSRSSVIKAAVFFSLIYIAINMLKKRTMWIVGGSFVVFLYFVYKNIGDIVKGYKFVYNFIYSICHLTEVKYFKYLDYDFEKQCITTFFVFCVWLIALVVYTFTITKPNPIPVLLVTFPLIEAGLYNGRNVPVILGILTVAYWLAVLGMCLIDFGEYSGGSGGFVRKENLFFPKRQMRLKVTEQCAIFIIVTVLLIMAGAVSVMKISGYKRSEKLNETRAEVKEAMNSFSMDDVASSISAITESFGFTFSYETHKLGNTSRVKYKNVTDLIATFDKAYEGAIYLKGYAGAVYGDNEWTELSDKAYKNADSLFDDFKEYDIYPQDFPYLFTDSAIDKNDYLSLNNNNITLWLEAKRKLNKSYAPYGTLNYGDMKYTLDTVVSSKDKDSTGYSYKFTPIEAPYSAVLLGADERMVLNIDTISERSWQDKISEYCEDNDITVNSDNDIVIDSRLHGDYSYNLNKNGSAVMAALLEESYSKFVYENYLQVPDSSELNEVRAEFSDIIEKGESADTPAEQLIVLNDIRDKMNSMVTYSLKPGRTPSNRDFVNYFLIENQLGYCSHYATSGVMLARMAGIPARYATGYIIVADDFNESSKNDDGSYTITVKDDRSHAWAEVYLDSFGWVPFEFTAGYSRRAIETNTTTTTSENSTQTVTTTTVKNTQPTSKNTNKNTATKPKTATTTHTPSRVSVTSIVNGSSGSNASGDKTNTVIPEIILSVLAVIAVIALVWLRRYLILQKRQKRFTSGNNKARIVAMYGYTEKLLRQLKIKHGNLMYLEYADNVESQYAGKHFSKGQFRSFMETVLLSSYSENSPDKEETKTALEFTQSLAKSVYDSSNIFKKLYMKILLVLI